jgi:hypothetical protein
MRTRNLGTMRYIRLGSRVLIFGFALWAQITFHASEVLAQIKLNQPPAANAGPGQEVALSVRLVFAAATLNGSASADPSLTPEGGWCRGVRID